MWAMSYPWYFRNADTRSRVLRSSSTMKIVPGVSMNYPLLRRVVRFAQGVCEGRQGWMIDCIDTKVKKMTLVFFTVVMPIGLFDHMVSMYISYLINVDLHGNY